MKPFIPVLLCTAALMACDNRTESGTTSSANDGPDKYGFTAPTAATIRANADVLNQLPFGDQQDFADARRGLIASADNLRIDGPGSGPVWDLTAYDFIQGDAPASVNPSLWRQAKLNNIHGLFEVTKGIYQLRGFDLANMTLIDGDTGWIVVDPLTSKETAQHAFEFAMQHLQRKPISAVVFTHSHVDHFGGATALVSAEQIASGKVDLIAPEGFMEEATSENSMAGTAMYRRALYMYGKRLPRSERAHVDTGLGKEPALGSSSVLPPNFLVTQTPQPHVIDGVPFVFQNAPHSEAPAELTFYLPEHNAWCGAELVSQQMHNVYTLRGAKVRDSLNWSNTIDDVLQRFGDAEIYFGSHHWPIWGNAQVVDFLKKQRDVYKYIHDQTIRMANAGLTPREIAEQIQLPTSLRNNFSTRGYYGTVSHNVKAVYQFYFGWYDGNPANLNPLPPVESARKTIEFMGGADAVLSKAQNSFQNGEYRWVAEVLNQLVFADPDNESAKALLARTYDQLGYVSESGPWRDVYLSGAYELRHGGPERGMDLALAAEQLRYMPLPRFLDTIAVSLDGPKADGEDLTVNFVFPDLHQSYVLQIENAVLHHWQRPPDPEANATLTLTHDLFIKLLTRQASAKEILFSEDLEVSGSKLDLVRFFSLFSMADGKFDIVTP